MNSPAPQVAGKLMRRYEMNPTDMAVVTEFVNTWAPYTEGLYDFVLALLSRFDMLNLSTP
jgi:hypothetical protein